MKRISILSFILMLLAIAGRAQNYVNVTASNIKNGGVPVALGTLCFTGTDNQDAVLPGFRAGDGNQIARPICGHISAGAVASFAVPNGDLTTPQNVCYRATVTISTQPNAPVLYYKCAQTSANNAWCVAGACNFDNLSPNNGLTFPQYAGPPGPTGATGPAGATGPPATFRGAYSGATTYAIGDAVSFGTPIQEYVSLVGANLNNQPDTHPSQWALAAAAGAAGANGLSAPWSSLTTYTLNSLASFNGELYYSLQNANINHTPQSGAGDAWWSILDQADVRNVGYAGGVDCSGVHDSRAALVAALQSGHDIHGPRGPQCQVMVQANAGSGLVATGFYGLNFSTWTHLEGKFRVFGCGAGTGPVVNLSKAGYYLLDDWRVELSDPTLCPGGSTFTIPLEWSNNIGSGSSTNGRFDNLVLTANGGPQGGGTINPSVASFGLTAQAGSNAVYVVSNPSWSNLGFHQISGLSIVNGNPYSVTVNSAMGTGCCWTQSTGQASVSLVSCSSNCGTFIGDYSFLTSAFPLLPVYTIVATQTLNLSADNTWHSLTVNWTGDAGHAGQKLGILIRNSSTVASGKTVGMFFDNVSVTGTGFSVNNGSFETLATGATLGTNANIYPTVGLNWDWETAYPQFVGLQVGGVPGDSNLEGIKIKHLEVYGGHLPRAMAGYNQGCCSEHDYIDNVGTFDVWRGLVGAWGGQIEMFYGDIAIGETYTYYAANGVPGGASYVPVGIAASRMAITGLTNDGSGPLVFSSIASGKGNVLDLYEPQIVAAPGPNYTIDASSIQNLNIYGGFAQNLSGAPLPLNAFVGTQGGVGLTHVTDAGTLIYGVGLNGAYLFGPNPFDNFLSVSASSSSYGMPTGDSIGGSISRSPSNIMAYGGGPASTQQDYPAILCWNLMTWSFSASAPRPDRMCLSEIGRLNDGTDANRTMVFGLAPDIVGGVPTHASYTFDGPFSGMSTQQVQAPLQVDLIPQGVTGSTTYTYKIAAHGTTGTSAASTGQTITNGNATLSGTINVQYLRVSGNCNSMTWGDGVPGPAGWAFDIYRTVGGATQGKIATVNAAYSEMGRVGSGTSGQYVYNDCGAVGDGTTAPTVNTTGGIALPTTPTITWNNDVGLQRHSTFGVLDVCASCIPGTPDSLGQLRLNAIGVGGAVPLAGNTIALNRDTQVQFGNQAVTGFIAGLTHNTDDTISVGDSRGARLPAFTQVGSNGDTGFSRDGAGIFDVGNGTGQSVAAAVVANNGHAVRLISTNALTGPVPVKADTGNANQVLQTTTTDTAAGVVIGVLINAPAGAGNGVVITSGIALMTLGTGTCTIGGFVIVDTTTNGRVKCTGTYTAGTVIGVALSAQTTIGSPLSVMVGLR